MSYIRHRASGPLPVVSQYPSTYGAVLEPCGGFRNISLQCFRLLTFGLIGRGGRFRDGMILGSFRDQSHGYDHHKQ